MVKTGARVAELQRLLVAAGMRVAVCPAAPRLPALPDGVQQQIFGLRRALGGVEASPALRPGGWDLAFDDGLLVELDEEFHFTRYRRPTLDAPFALALPWRLAYLDHIAQHEARAIAPGGRWSNASTDRMFGGSDAVGSFEHFGSSRWKQRALYDAVKDAAAATGVVRLSRVSIYDVVDNQQLERVLRGKVRVDTFALRTFLEERSTSWN